MPKISVIIPVYNTEKYLRRCLESVCNQTLSGIEIICINDCSTDNSLSILKEFSGRIKIINLHQNSGAANARNIGIEIAEGEYLSFIDSDDFVDIDFYEKLYNRAVLTKADAVKGNYRCAISGSIDYSLNEYIKTCKTNFAYAYCSAIFRKDVILKNNIRFPNLSDMEDPVFTFKFALIANSVEIVDTNINIVKRENSQTSGIPDFKRIQDKFMGLKLILDYANNSDINAESYCHVLSFWVWQTFINSIKSRDSELRKFIAENSIEIYENIKYKNLFLNLLTPRNKYLADFLKNKDVASLIEFEKRIILNKIRNKLSSKIKVSVIIPVYNAEKFLRRCLNSAVNQTLKDIEIICVDDCSSDNSLDILNEYAKKFSNIKVFTHLKNEGESSARNTGINNAKGEFIGFLDNDDELDLEFYEKLYKKSMETDSEIVVGNVEDISYSGTKSVIEHLNLNIENNKYFFVSHWWRAIYKTSLIKENNIFLPNGVPLGGDLLFLHNAVFKTNKISVVNDVYYHYYRREDSGDSKFWNKIKFDSAMNIYETITKSLNIKQIYKLNPKGYIHAYLTYFAGPIYAAMHVQDRALKKECVTRMFEMYKACKLKDDLDLKIAEYYPKSYEYFISQDIEGFCDFLMKNTTINKFICTNRIHQLRKNFLNNTKEGRF